MRSRSSDKIQCRILHMCNLCLFVMLFSVFLVLYPAGVRAEETEKKNISPEMEIQMLDVGQGLSILVRIDEQYLLYDGGGRDFSSKVVSYLSNQGVEHLDYMIASHYDEDHIAGLVGVLNTTTVSTILCPEYETDTRIYQSFMKMCNESGAAVIHPAAGDNYTFGTGEFRVLGPSDEVQENENNRSVVIRIQAGDFSCLISGDAEKEEEDDILSTGLPLNSTVYVAGHHGSASSSTPEFLDAIQPQTALISVGTDNSYGHPSAAVLREFQERGIEVLRTDLLGDITISSDKSIEKNHDNKEKDTEQVYEYVLNTNTCKFHYPYCSSVDQMSEKNKKHVSGTREEIIAEGYDPCGNCHP